ncbi:type VI secretion system baseplate subunit TssF [Ningiella sp. W23]|uniref:type VI secretion system baseplate subunit TssF n=1 Tax=Ningiella sp. W23 TaxID=3023715 RepID=UPI003756F9DE
MAHNKYFQDELNYLRELGAQFAEHNPSLAKLLSEEGDDPDVERLFEGFAFLTGRIRQKLDDELPEISHSLIELLWPNYLRPVPAMSILEFTPRKHILSECVTIKRGARVQSAEVDGTPCIFQSCYDVEVSPIRLSAAHTKDKTNGTELLLEFTVEPGVDTKAIGLNDLRLFLHDNQKIPVANALYLSFFRYLNHFDIHINYVDGSKETVKGLDKHAVKQVGFDDDENLLPSSEKVFSGYRLIQEYFQFQNKFLFIDVCDIGTHIQKEKVESFSLQFNFSKLFTNNINLSKEHFKLFCTPIVNLFEFDATPIRKDNLRIEYVLRPETRNQSHYEIFSVNEVVGKLKGATQNNIYVPYEEFEHHDEEYSDDAPCFYKIRTVPATVGDGVDHYIYLHNPQLEEQGLNQETISAQLTCSNRHLATTLQTGQIAYDTGDSPDIVTFKNITKTTNALPPPFEKSLHWRLISNLALQYKSLNSVEAIRLLIKYYDFAAFDNRQKQRSNQQMYEGIENIDIQNYDRLIKGVPVTGLKTVLRLRESKFGAKGIVGESNMFLFASVLNHYFAQYARTNSFHVLEVHAIESGEIYQWDREQGLKARF